MKTLFSVGSYTWTAVFDRKIRVMWCCPLRHTYNTQTIRMSDLVEWKINKTGITKSPQKGYVSIRIKWDKYNKTLSPLCDEMGLMCENSALKLSHITRISHAVRMKFTQNDMILSNSMTTHGIKDVCLNILFLPDMTLTLFGEFSFIYCYILKWRTQLTHIMWYSFETIGWNKYPVLFWLICLVVTYLCL